MIEYTVKVYKDRTEWTQNDNLHRDNGPAIEYANGNKFWYQNGLRHRVDGPAIEYANGDKFWYQKGKLHREDGPAIEYANGNKRWFKQGVEYFPDQVKEMTVADLEKVLGYSIKVVKG